MRPKPSSVPPARYTIAAVSKLTGVSCHTLRIWERRYGFPDPGRSPSGHRRYNAGQVELLRRVAQELHTGIGPAEAIAQVRGASNGHDKTPASIDGLAAALMRADLDTAERAYQEVVAPLSAVEQITGVIEPLMIDVGERWFRGDCQIYQERCVSGFLRRKLSILLDQAQTANPTPKSLALVGTAQGERHEGGALMLALLLEHAGWRAMLLGVDLPTTEYQKAIDVWRPAAVCISFVMSRNVNRRFAELGKLRGAPVIVGGRSVVNYRSLARRYGLIALTGSGPTAVGRLIDEARRWAERIEASTSPVAVKKPGH